MARTFLAWHLLLTGSLALDSNSRPRRIAIIGAGPGGLTLANALLGTSKRQIGRPFGEVVVFDRAQELRPSAGGGIQINGGNYCTTKVGVATKN